MKPEIPYHLENYIGGNLIGPLSGNFIDNVNPATGMVVSQIPDSNVKDVNAAVVAAKKAFPQWSTTTTKKIQNIEPDRGKIESNLENGTGRIGW